MNKFFKVGCLIIFILVGLGIAGASLKIWYEDPSQSIAFLNISEVARSVTFERVEKNGKLADSYTIDSDIQPNETLIKKVPDGDYKVTVWNKDNSLFGSTDFKVQLKDPKKSSYELYRFDLAMDKIYTIVDLNAMYKGNSFATHMANAVGTKREKLQIEKLYDGSHFFLVPETYTSRTFVDIDDKLPKNVKYGEMVYGLFAFSKTVPRNEIETAIYAQILKK